jgi:hypothetical protein
MPIVDQTAHIGIQRHFKDSSTATIEENLKKSRRALYSLIRSGLLPVSAISSAQVGAEHLMDPIFAPTPAQSKISSK